MDKISTPGFLLMKSHGQKEPSPWGRKRVRRNLATKQQQYTVGLHDILLPCRNDSSLLCFISTSARPWRLVGNKSFRWKEAWVVHWVVPLLRLLITVAKVQLDDWRLTRNNMDTSVTRWFGIRVELSQCAYIASISGSQVNASRDFWCSMSVSVQSRENPFNNWNTESLV